MKSQKTGVVLVLISGIMWGISIVACSLGLDLGDSITATVSCLSNVGPAMGTTLNPSSNFSQVSNSLCLLFSVDMILGRLEILPVLICFTRMFYKR